MACFSLAWLQAMFIWFIIIFAVLALFRLLVGFFVGAPMWPVAPWPPTAGVPPGFGGFILAALNIVIWAFIAICAVYFIFALIGCLISFAGGLPSFPGGRRGDLGILLALV